MLYSHENWVLGSIFINMEGICVIEQCMVWSYCNKYMDIYVLRQSNNDYLWMMKLYDFYFFIILFSMLDFSCIATLADWAAKTKCYRLGGLNSRHLFLTVWSLRSPRSRCQSIWFSVRALFLLCRCLPSYCVLTWRRGGSERMNCSLSSFFFFSSFLSFSWAALAVYGGSQASGPIGAVAAGLHQSPSNVGSELRLRPTPQLTARLDS